LSPNENINGINSRSQLVAKMWNYFVSFWQLIELTFGESELVRFGR